MNMQDLPPTEPPHKVRANKKSDHDQNVVTTLKGGGITFVGKLFQHLMGLGFVFMMARLLGAEQFGLYRMAIIIVTITAAISLIGLDGGIKRYIPIARNERNKAKIWGIIQIGVGVPFLVGLALTAIILLAAKPIAVKIFNDPELIPILRLVSLAIPFLVLGHSFAAITLGFKKVQYDAYARDIAFDLIKLILAVLAIVLGFGVMGVVVSYVIAAVLSTLMLIGFVHRFFSLKRPLKQAEHHTREIVRFSLPLFFSLLLNQFGRRLETLVLGIFGVMTHVGVYSAILSISGIGNLGYIALRKIATPIISELHSQQKIAELKKYYQTITKWAVSFNLPFFLIIVLFSDDLLRILGKEFTMGSLGLIILASGILIDAGTGICGIVISFSGHSKVTFYNSIFYIAVTLILDFILIPQFGLVGAACAGALSMVAVNLLRLIEVYVLIDGILPFNWTFLKPISAAVFASAVVYGMRQFVFVSQPFWQFMTLSILLWALYIGAILALKLSDEDRLIVGKVLRRFKIKNKKQAENGTPGKTRA